MSTAPIDIIILDDNRDISTMMQSILQFAGHSVQVCSDKELLFSALAVSTPRLILMDMLLAGIDGRDICKQLKEETATKDIPVLMISAHPDAEETCKQAGANGFLEKPFEIDALLAKARSLLSKQTSN